MSEKQHQKGSGDLAYEEIEEGSPTTGQKNKLSVLKKKLKACEKEKKEYLDGWQRAKADLINFRQRQERQQQEWQKLINEGLILELLPVLDTLEAATQKATEQEKESCLLIKKQLEEVLKKQGLEKINSQNVSFNPSEHEVIERKNPPAEQEKDGLVEEISPGYKLNGKIIRTAKVRIK